LSKLVGLSLSFCVKHILEGKVPLKDVAFIVPGFKWDNVPESERRPSENYYSIYWRDWDRATVDALLARLEIRGGREGGHNVAHGIWWPLDQWDETVLDDADKRLHTNQLGSID
jgi:hypothetical protein